MAQTTSERWKTMIDLPGTRAELRYDIAGVTYGPEAVIAQGGDRALFETVGIGGTMSAGVTLSLLAEDVPRGAEVRRFCRLVNGEQVSEWLPAGVYFVRRRTFEDGVWDIEASDVLGQADRPWVPRQELTFPMTAPAAVGEFCRLLGCELDSRTKLDPAYLLDYPADDTIRQELGYIAAGHGGNWTVTGEGRLLLTPLDSPPAETNLLVTERGRAITFGGVRILV